MRKLEPNFRFRCVFGDSNERGRDWWESRRLSRDPGSHLSQHSLFLSLSLAVCLLVLITLITAGRWCLKIRNWGLLPRQDFSAFLFSASHSSSFFCVFFFYFSKVDWVLAAVRKYLENPKWLLDRRGGERFSHDILKACIYHGTGFLKSPYSLSNTLRYNNTQCSLGFTICSISINQLFAQNYLCPLIIRFVRHNVSIAPICRALMT